MADYKTLPDVRYSQSHLELTRFISSSRTHGGLMNIVEYGDPIWKLSLTTAPLNYSDGAMVDAWFQSLRGGLIPVEVKAPHYCTPRAHIKNRGAETKSGEIATVSNVTRSRFQIQNVNAALFLSVGDFISLVYDGKYFLARVAKFTPTSDTQKVVEIEPPLPSFIMAGATCYFDRAQLLMRPIWDTYEPWRHGARTVSFTFSEVRA